MPRRSIFDRPMTVAERQRRCRARKRREQTTFDPAPSEADLREWLVVAAAPDANDDSSAEVIRHLRRRTNDAG